MADNLTDSERTAIEKRRLEGREYLTRILVAQAKGRWVERETIRRQKEEHPGRFKYSNTGPAITDTQTGNKYEFVSDNELHMDAHGMRPCLRNEFFEFIRI